jgi:hypothetical protein
MRINITNKIDFYIEKEELDDVKINEWFSINKKFIENMIKSHIHNYGYAFGGASELYFDIKEFYREHPYNLEEKYSGSLLAA